VGVAGFVDETALHQLLHRHHFYDRSTTDAGLVSDGLFHASGWFALVFGLAGAGGFQLYDGTIQHKLLGLHQIRYAVNLTPYDWTWNVVAVVLPAAGLLFLRRAKGA
jgi:uncharacterized membrane protein